MKFLLPVLIAHVSQCAASKSWNSDSYQEDSFGVFGWISYLKRLSLIALMLSGVVLYYVPESRPHARKICHTLIDLTANGLKAVLSTPEDEQMYEKIKNKCHRVRYEQSLAAQKRVSKEVQDDDGDLELTHKIQGKRAKMFVDDALPMGCREKKKINMKSSKDHRQSRQRLRSSIIKDISGDLSKEVTKPVYFYSDKLEDLSKYLKNNMYGVRRPSEASVENYALLISGSPQQMAMLDEKYEKDDVVIVQDPYAKIEYRECGTSTDKLSSIAEVSGSEQEGPTRDYNDHPIESGMETYVKDVDLISVPEGDSRYSVSKSLYQTSQYQHGGECCGNRCSASSRELNNDRNILVSSTDTKNVLKSSRSMSLKLHKKIEEKDESLQPSNYTKYNHKGDRSMKMNRKIDFQKEEKTDYTHQCQENGHQYEDACRIVRRKKSRTSELPKGFCCSDVSYFTDRSGEADDETSHRGERVTARHDLDEKPQRENYLYKRNSDDSMYDHVCDDFDAEPILKNGVKPALLRAVNWIFGGCPEAGKVGKEGSHEIADEWLL